jgi:hypothetical protein
VFHAELIRKRELIGEVVNLAEHVEGVELFEAFEIVKIHLFT